MPLNYAGAKNVATSTKSENDFDLRKMIVLNATYRLSKSLESFEDGKEEAFLNVALSKLAMHELGKFRLPAPVDPQNPTPAEDPQTKFDEERGRRLSNVELVNEALRIAKTDKHVGTDLGIWQAIGLLGGWYALLGLAAGIGLGGFIVALLIGIGIDFGASTSAVAGFLLGLAGGGLFGVVAGFVIGTVRAATCHTKGDYDMPMQLIIPLIYRYGHLLDADVYDHVLYDLLANHTKGGASWTHEVTAVCGATFPLRILNVGETENHILMIETARYLTNNLLRLKDPTNQDYDNSQNGLQEWMLDHLQKFLKNDFWEFNSRPYQRLVVMALHNLHEFAPTRFPDLKVAKAARIVLDYLAAKYAVSSNGLRRAAPFRRLPERQQYTSLLDRNSDEETWRYLMLAGPPAWRLGINLSVLGVWMAGLVPDEATTTLLHAALGRYRVPGMILDLIINKGGQQYLQRFHHGEWDHGYGDPAVEIYYSSKSYLITGGGIYAAGRAAEDSYAMPITLMPSFSGIDWQEFIRITGTINPSDRTTQNLKDRANMGVAPGFACGRDVVIPEALLEDLTCRTPGDLTDQSCQCARQVGKNWTFINYASTKCSRKNRDRENGFYVAVWQWNPRKEKNLVSGDYGLFAVVEVDVDSRDYPFDAFINDIIQLNGSSPQYLPHSANLFKFPTGRGPEIQVYPTPYEWNDEQTALWNRVNRRHAAGNRHRKMVAGRRNNIRWRGGSAAGDGDHHFMGTPWVCDD